MASIHSRQPLTLQGEPHRLVLVSSMLNDTRAVRIDLPEGLTDARGLQTIDAAVHARRGEAGRVRLRLPRFTPPGSYHARLHHGADTLPLEIDVLPHRLLKAAPASLVFSSDGAGNCEVPFALANGGNMPVMVPDSGILGIYDDDGIEAAFAAAYGEQTDDAAEIVRRFILGLRAGHGGLLKFRIGGAGPLAPGERRDCVATMRPHTRLRAGHSYHGVWKLHDLNYAVHVIVAKPAKELLS